MKNNLDKLRNELIIEQKKGLPFIATSAVIWVLITIVSSLPVNIMLKNILVFCCSVPLLPLAWIIGKKINVDVFSNKNELGKLGFLFTMNQILYLLIVMWVFNAVPDKMIMVYAMVFGGHLLPYSWLYKSKAYKIFAILIPLVALVVGSIFNSTILAVVITIIEVIFAFMLKVELKEYI